MIAATQIQTVVTYLEQHGLSDETISGLRQVHKPLHFTYCMDDDLPNSTPAYEAANFNLYLIDGRDHCLCLTNDYAVATGLVVAEIIPE